MSIINQRSFAAGEISPELYYRVDLARYTIGLRTARNYQILKQGGAESRPGTTFIAEVKDSTSTVYFMKYRVDVDTDFLIEVGLNYFRFFKNDAQVLETAVNITGITKADPAVVTATAHGYSNGAEVYISDVIGMTEVNGRNFKVANKTANTFELTDLGGNNIDSTGYTTYSSGGTSEKVFEVDTTGTSLNTAAAIKGLRSEQKADRLYLSNQRYLKRNTDTSWDYVTIVESDIEKFGPSISISIPAGNLVTYTVLEVNSFGQSSVATNEDTGNALPTSGSPITVTIGTSPTTDVVFYIFRADNSTGKFQREGVFGLIGIVAGDALVSTTFVDDGISADYTQTPADRFGGDLVTQAFCFYQDRLIGAANDNSTISGSLVGFPWIFGQIYGEPAADSPFEYNGIGGGVTGIHHLVNYKRLVIFADSGEFAAFGDDAGNITPFAINIRRQSGFGSDKFVFPVIFDDTLLFVQTGGSTVRALNYDVGVDGFSSGDMTNFSSHLFRGYTIKRWSVQNNPNPILWAVRSDGSLLTMTYSKEQSVLAWTRNDLQDATVTDVISIPGPSTGDRVYALVTRTIDGRTVQYIEKFSQRNPSDVKDYKLLDSNLSYDGRNTDTSHTMTLSGGTNWTYDETITLTSSASYFASTYVDDQIHITGSDGTIIRFTIEAYSSATVVTGKPNKTVPAAMRSSAISDWSHAVGSVTGLWHLEGEDIAVFADGFVVANPNNDSYDVITVTNGTIALDKPYSVICAGKPYYADIETLDIDVLNGETLIDKNKLTSHVTVGTYNTRGLWAGPKPPSDDSTDPKEGLTEFKLRDTEDYDSPPALNNKQIDTIIQSEWNNNGRVFIRQIDPVPSTILSIAPSGLYPFRG